MKNIFKLLPIFILGAVISSCSSDWLDVYPSDGIPSGSAVNNYNDATVALTGVYDALQGSSSTTVTGPSYYGARMIYYGDVKADDMQSRFTTARTGPSYVMNNDVTTNLEIWKVPYVLIRRANSLIQALDENKVKDATEADVADMKGQALTMRALAHFDLLRVYSKFYTKNANKEYGIPIMLKPVDYTYVAGRNTVEEVYNQVIADLTEAIKLLREKRDKDNGKDFMGSGYINRWAAKALLARVYLYKGDNDNAYKTALDVINNGGYTLWGTDDYQKVWAKQGTSEVLFEIVNYDTDDWVDRESIGYLYSEDGYEDAVMTKAFVDFVETKYKDDVRQSVMIRTSLSDDKAIKDKPWGINKVYINKYPGREGLNDIRVNNLAILRLSETYLIAAEAAAKLGDNTNAAKYLNSIVLRGNPSAKAVTSAEATVDRILEENRIEFVGEGHRFFDLIRNNKRIVRYTSEEDRGWHLPLSAESRSFDETYFRALLPIPFDEIKSNPAIKDQQNPGY